MTERNTEGGFWDRAAKEAAKGREGAYSMAMGLGSIPNPAEMWEAQAVAFSDALEKSQAEILRLGEALNGLKWAGIRLSNIAFNLSQRDTLDDNTRELLRREYKAWDATLHAALPPSQEQG